MQSASADTEQAYTPSLPLYLNAKHPCLLHQSINLTREPLFLDFSLNPLFDLPLTRYILLL
jgi:hypothetical protein